MNIKQSRNILISLDCFIHSLLDKADQLDEDSLIAYGKAHGVSSLPISQCQCKSDVMWTTSQHQLLKI